jgi:hypothetical protein
MGRSCQHSLDVRHQESARHGNRDDLGCASFPQTFRQAIVIGHVPLRRRACCTAQKDLLCAAAALRWLRRHPDAAVVPMHSPTLMAECEPHFEACRHRLRSSRARSTDAGAWGRSASGACHDIHGAGVRTSAAGVRRPHRSNISDCQGRDGCLPLETMRQFS